MIAVMEYREVYSRNIGLFTEEEQERLRNAKVAIAGVGGVGGIQAVTLARMGLGEISIMDPGFFDEPDMNRQYGAMLSTLGKNKASALGEILKDVNPFLKVNVYPHEINEIEKLREFIEKSALVVDAIDYAGFNHKVLLAQVAREKGLYNLSAPIPDFGALLMVFDPNGMTLEEFLGAPSDIEQQKIFKVPSERLFGNSRFPRNLKDMLNGHRNFISTNAGAAALNGGLLATEAALIITRKRAPEDIIAVPNVIFVDMLSRKFDIYNPLSD